MIVCIIQGTGPFHRSYQFGGIPYNILLLFFKDQQISNDNPFHFWYYYSVTFSFFLISLARVYHFIDFLKELSLWILDTVISLYLLILFTSNFWFVLSFVILVFICLMCYVVKHKSFLLWLLGFSNSLIVSYSISPPQGYSHIFQAFYSFSVYIWHLHL